MLAYASRCDLATGGMLPLQTKFLFGFTKRTNAVDLEARPDIKPETPRDWNLIGLMPRDNERISDIDNVGIVWVHVVGGTVYFRPDVEWGKTWAAAGSWKSDYVKKAWADRVPDGTHPWDPFAGGGTKYVGAGSGRVVFGCVFEHAAVMNDAVKMGRPDHKEGFGENGYYVYNNGHKGFDVSGNWVTIARNHNERSMLREGHDPEGIGGWELTLDGHLESSPGGNGAISDNLSRAFDLAGRNVWVHGNTYNSLGSDPGNDGEGILCQAHGGSQIYSWAITYNHHDKGNGETGYIGGWDVNVAGALFDWNVLPGWVGSTNVGRRDCADVAFVGNRAGGGVKPMKGAVVCGSGDAPGAPKDVRVQIHGTDAVLIGWTDAGDNEVGFRVDRRIADGQWTTIAYRPPRIQGHPENPQMWIDYLAPRDKPLVYRVVSLDEGDSNQGASKPTKAIVIQ